MAQASFASPWMLLWGLAAALPVLLHFWNRRRRRETEWAAMEFLIAAVRKNARRLRLEQIALLAVRVAILLFFAAALAEPLLIGVADPSLAQSSPIRRPIHSILAIDGSYSMAYRDWRASEPGKSAFARACESAAKMVRESRPGDLFSLVLLGTPPERIIGEPTPDRARALAEIEALEIRAAGADLAASLRAIQSLAESSSRDDVGQSLPPPLVQVRIFSDLCATTWAASIEEPCRGLLAELDARYDFQVVDVGAGESGENETVAADNFAIVDLRVEDSHVVADREVTLQASVRDFSIGEQRNATVRRQIEVFVDGRREHVAEVAVPVSGEETLSFTHRFRNPGQHVVRAALAADGLPLDDERFLVVAVDKSLAVLCVEGQPGAAKYISLALTGRNSSIKVTTQSEASWGAALNGSLRLAEYDCLFLCNVGRLSRAEAVALREYVRAGNGLVTVLGDRAQSAAYNNELVEGPAPLLPARLSKPAPIGEYVLDPLEYRRPLAAAFRGHEASGLLTTPIWKYFELSMRATASDAADGARGLNEPSVVLQFTNGDPAIVEQSFGAGRSLLVATDLSDLSIDRGVDPPSPWNAWPAWPSFVPVVRELLAAAIAGSGEQKQLLVGQSLEGHSLVGTAPMGRPNATGAKAADPPTVIMPDGRRATAFMSEGPPEVWRWNDTSQRGVYSVEDSSSKAAATHYAVNLETSESSLARIDAAVLPQRAARGKSLSGVPGSDAAPAARPLFRFALIGVLALLVVETSLGVFFGRRRRDP